MQNIEALLKRQALGRQPQGMAAALLPYEKNGEIAVDAFKSHLKATHAAGLTNAVNMDTGYVNYLSDHDNRHARATYGDAGCC